MRFSTLWWFAWRYGTGALKTPALSSMLILSLCALSISSCATSLIMSIMMGFEHATRTTLQSINPPITIDQSGRELNINALRTCLETEFPEIIGASPTAYHHGLMRVHDEHDPEFITIKAIDPVHEPLVTTFTSAVQNDQRELNNILHDNHVIVGYKLARDMGLHVGQPVEIVYSPDFQTRGNKLLLDTETVMVSALVQTGIDDIDRTFVFMHHDYFTTLFKQGMTAMGIALAPGTDTTTTIMKLRNRLHLEVYTWDELYQPLMQALKLERYAMMMILALVILLSSMCIGATLFMLVRLKKSDIALFKAMGMKSRDIRSIFLRIGLTISAVATVSGLVVARAGAMILSHCSWFRLPDVYYTSHVPVYTSWTLYLIIFIAIMALSYIVLLLPLRTLRTMSISEVLRFEA